MRGSAHVIRHFGGLIDSSVVSTNIGFYYGFGAETANFLGFGLVSVTAVTRILVSVTAVTRVLFSA